MSPIIYNINNAVFRENMAAFDYDWTMVNPKDGKIFPSGVDDWEWLFPNLPSIIKKYYDDGFMIVIFTNQSKSWKCEQIKIVAQELQIPLFIAIATEKTHYKPNIILFESLVNENKINKNNSFFVGDALGRKGDFANTDRVFAENIGIQWFSPESICKQESPSIEIPNITISNEPEVVIMVGFPGSGKSSVAKQLCSNDNYIHIEGDVYKTPSKMKKKAFEFIQQKKSVVFDATNSSIKKRAEYVNFAKTYGYTVRCLHVTTPLDVSYKRNKMRNLENQVPLIAYSVFKKHYEEPTEKEGFVVCRISC
jgi:bifunctional polynucleotide phosphatase/kinase